MLNFLFRLQNPVIQVENLVDPAVPATKLNKSMMLPSQQQLNQPVVSQQLRYQHLILPSKIILQLLLILITVEKMKLMDMFCCQQLLHCRQVQLLLHLWRLQVRKLLQVNRGLLGVSVDHLNTIIIIFFSIM